ncbi:hypothetical protein GGR42_000760 [Saonia flava]|uniref:Uncharacterized protein n=1 Tax=Saonia flava TaxID=523696 RepID=A0A846QQB5_9FLAO|nr:hypothetical protein [Saonia flava]NJB70298.1 hypothetical protein [Saonia flava]
MRQTKKQYFVNLIKNQITDSTTISANARSGKWFDEKNIRWLRYSRKNIEYGI